MTETKTLVFKGEIASGMGQYSDMDFPVRGEVSTLPADWPEQLCPGSLNINLAAMPQELETLGPGRAVQKLDNETFPPAGTIPRDKITNNMIGPTAAAPQRGNARIWRCTVETASVRFNAFAVRRHGSAYYDVVELMSDKKLRQAYGLKDGDIVTLTLYAASADFNGAAQAQPQLAQKAPSPSGLKTKLLTVLGMKA